jgi:hypothetical protein
MAAQMAGSKGAMRAAWWVECSAARWDAMWAEHSVEYSGALKAVQTAPQLAVRKAGSMASKSAERMACWTVAWMVCPLAATKAWTTAAPKVARLAAWSGSLRAVLRDEPRAVKLAAQRAGSKDASLAALMV